MKKRIQLVCGILAFFLILGINHQVAGTEQYPGVYAGDDYLVFVQGSDEHGVLQGIVVLSYEYSMDWIITVGELGAISELGLLLTGGHQYVYNADGTKRSESEFTSLEKAVVWDDLEFQSLPSSGYYLAPMVQGGLAYALVETRDGLPAQLVLAREAFDSGSTLNLFEGFLYQLSGGTLTAQVAFTEMAFGTQGLIRGRFPEDFPPPPEDYPVMYPAYAEPSYPPPGGSVPVETSVPVGSTGGVGFDLPQGTPVPEEELVDRPRFTLEAMHDYEVPPIRRIGVVAFQSSAELDGYESLCDEYLQEALSRIEGLEAVYIPFDSTLFGGAVIYDRATWLCGEYGVDALMMSELDEFEFVGGELVMHMQSTADVLVSIETQLIEGAGGSIYWGGEFEATETHDSQEMETDQERLLRTDLGRVILGLVDDLAASGALDGGYVE